MAIFGWRLLFFSLLELSACHVAWFNADASLTFYLSQYFEGIAGEHRERPNQKTCKTQASEWVLNWWLNSKANLFKALKILLRYSIVSLQTPVVTSYCIFWLECMKLLWINKWNWWQFVMKSFKGTDRQSHRNLISYLRFLSGWEPYITNV